MAMSDRELGIYVNDHLTGSTGGLELARRAGANADDEERAAMWEGLATEIAEERETLIDIRKKIDAKPNLPKYAIAWVGEKLGRLKTNGHLVGRSELGQMLELEMLLVGVTGKLSMWKALERLGDPRFDDINFGWLIERAESQRRRLEQYRMNLVPAALG